MVNGAVAVSGADWQVNDQSTLAGSGTVDLTLSSPGLTYSSSSASTFAGAIVASSGTAGVTILGGTLTLTGGNSTYRGNTLVYGPGVLHLAASNALPYGGGRGNLGVYLGSGAGTLDLGGFVQNVNGLANGNGVIDNSVGNGTLSVGRNNVTSTYFGVLQDSGGTLSLTKLGNGALTLSAGSNPNTYSGATTVSAGVLAASTVNSLSPNSAYTVGGGTLDVSAAGGSIKSITLNSGGALNLGISGDPVMRLTLTDTTSTATSSGTINVISTGVQSLGLYALLGSYAAASGTLVPGTLPSGYRLYAGPRELDMIHLAGVTMTADFRNGTSIRTGSGTIGVNLSNFAPTNSDNAIYKLSTTGASNTLSGATGTLVASGGTSTSDITGTYTALAGTQSFTASIANTGSYTWMSTPSPVTITETAYDYARPSYAASLAFNNVRVGATRALTVGNTTISNSAYQDSLNVTPGTIANIALGVSGSFNLAAGNSGSVTYTANTAGTLGATSTLGLVSSANGVTGLSNSTLATGNVSVSGAAYDYARPSYAASLAFNNVRVGATRALTVGNTTISNSAYQDSLNVTPNNGGNGALGVSGSFNLAAGSSGSVTYTANTAGTLGATSTLGLVSSANGVTGLSNSTLATGNVSVSGAAYDYARPSYAASLAFGNVRVGATRALTVGNTTISNSAYQDSLNVTPGTIANSTLGVSGSFNLAAGNSGSVTYTANTAVCAGRHRDAEPGEQRQWRDRAEQFHAGHRQCVGHRRGLRLRQPGAGQRGFRQPAAQRHDCDRHTDDHQLDDHQRRLPGQPGGGPVQQCDEQSQRDEQHTCRVQAIGGQQQQLVGRLLSQHQHGGHAGRAGGAGDDQHKRHLRTGCQGA